MPHPWHGVRMDNPPLLELQRLIARHGATDAAPLRSLPNVRLVIGIAPTRPFGHIYEPTLALVAQGIKCMILATKMFECCAGQYLIVPVELPMEAHIAEATADAPFLSFGLRLNPAAIATLVLEVGSANSKRDDPAGIKVNDLKNDLIDPVVRLLRLLDRPSDIPVLGPAVEREILWRLINGPQGSLVQQIGLADSRMARVGRAIRWIRDHYAGAVKNEELASIAGMSLTSFHRHFRAVTSMSPIQYQKKIRLHAARTRLMSAAEDVAEVGFAVGYDSPSQFSREYRRLFGRPPGQDGRNLRQPKGRLAVIGAEEG